MYPSFNSNGGPSMKKIQENKFKYYWRTMSRQHCLLTAGYISAPIYWSIYAPCAEHLCTMCQYFGAFMHHAPIYWRNYVHQFVNILVHRTQKMANNFRVVNKQRGGGSFGVPIMDKNYFISVVATSSNPCPDVS